MASIIGWSDDDDLIRKAHYNDYNVVHILQPTLVNLANYEQLYELMERLIFEYSFGKLF